MTDKKARPFDFLNESQEFQSNKRFKEEIVSDTSSESADDERLQKMAKAFKVIIEVKLKIFNYLQKRSDN